MLKTIQIKNLIEHFDKKNKALNNFAYKQKNKIIKYYYEIKIPDKICDCYNNIIQNKIGFEEFLSNNFDTKNLKLELNGYHDFFEIGVEKNTAIIITTNKTMNEQIIKRFMKVLYKAFVQIQNEKNEEIIDNLTNIEELNLHKHCLDCKLYVLCKDKNTNEIRETKKCWYLSNLLTKTEQEIKELKLENLESLQKYLEVLKKIEEIRCYFPIKTSSNAMLRKFSADNIKKIFENKDINKMQFFKKE